MIDPNNREWGDIKPFYFYITFASETIICIQVMWSLQSYNKTPTIGVETIIQGRPSEEGRNSRIYED